jgi:peptidoglycan/xylan/chitin deacetylase (PgdA/CDA1 family)
VTIRPVLTTRLLTAVFAALVLSASVAACASNGPTGAHWVAGSGSPRAAKGKGRGAGGGSTTTPAPGGDDAIGPADDGGPGTGSGPSTTPGSPTPSPTGDYLARVPAFGPRPPAGHIQLPGGGGMTPWLSRIPTDQPVAFLTIDDGWIKRPEALPLLQKAGVPVTLFLTINAIRDNPGYFRQLRDAGAVIEAHTITHAKLAGQSYDFQKREACGSADQLAGFYGRRPLLFRPPFGEKDNTTLKVVHDCGMHAAFFWKETVDKGIVRYQSGNTIQRGDIILMHFRDRFVDDFIAALQAIKDAGLTPGLLEDYVT